MLGTFHDTCRDGAFLLVDHPVLHLGVALSVGVDDAVDLITLAFLLALLGLQEIITPDDLLYCVFSMLYSCFKLILSFLLLLWSFIFVLGDL